MRKLIFILLLVMPVLGQTPISPDFYIYEKSVYRVEHKVIFTGKTTGKNSLEISDFFLNCHSHTYIILDKMRVVGKSSIYKVYKTPKIRLIQHSSPMWYAEQEICK